MAKKTVTQHEEDFIDELRESLDEAERLMREAAEATGDKATEMREAALRSLRNGRDSLRYTQGVVVERGREAAKATDHYVHDHPWKAIGVAGVVGLLFGLIVGRK